MSDDLLARATGALRDESGQRESTRAAVGRVRVLTALRARNARRRRLGSASVAACVTLLCAGAWAAATGRLPLGRLLREGTSVGAPSATPAHTTPPQRARAIAPSAQPAPPVVAPSTSTTTIDEPHSTSVIPRDSSPAPSAPVVRHAVVAARAPARASHLPVSTHVAIAPAPTAPTAPSINGPAGSSPEVPLAPVAVEDPAEALYRAAHVAHFSTRDPQAALPAWERYLAAAPDGRFAPEARYNRALSLVRLGRVSEAREALAPFAEAAEGSYRQREAAVLRARLAASPATDGAAPLTSPSAR
jgi:hypothetical protein